LFTGRNSGSAALTSPLFSSIGSTAGAGEGVSKPDAEPVSAGGWGFEAVSAEVCGNRAGTRRGAPVTGKDRVVRATRNSAEPASIKSLLDPISSPTSIKLGTLFLYPISSGK